MDPSRSHRLVHVINNCEDIFAPDNTKQIVTFFFLCFDLSYIKFLINSREKQELPGVEPTHLSLMYLYSHIWFFHCLILSAILIVILI